MDNIAREGALCALAILQYMVILDKKKIGGKDTKQMLAMIDEMGERLRGAGDPEQGPTARRVVASIPAREHWGY